MRTKTRPITEVTIEETKEVTTEGIFVETTVVILKGITEAMFVDTKAIQLKQSKKLAWWT